MVLLWMAHWNYSIWINKFWWLQMWWNLRYIKGLNADQVSSRCLEMISYIMLYRRISAKRFLVIQAHVHQMPLSLCLCLWMLRAFLLLFGKMNSPGTNQKSWHDGGIIPSTRPFLWWSGTSRCGIGSGTGEEVVGWDFTIHIGGADFEDDFLLEIFELFGLTGFNPAVVD